MAIEVNTVPGMTPSTVLIQQVTLFVIHPTVSSVSICFRKYIYKIEKRVKRSRDIELINTFFSLFLMGLETNPGISRAAANVPSSILSHTA